MREIKRNYIDHVDLEASPDKEALNVKFSGITLSGRSGTGKTKTAESLSEILHIPPRRNIKTGQLIRKISGTLKSSEEFIPRDIEVDIEMDNMQRELIRKSTTRNPFILEGRLAGVIASEEKVKNPLLPVISILLVAPSKERIKRVKNRHNKDIGRKMEAGETGLHFLTSDRVRTKEAKREKEDLKIWRKLHPQLKDIDPFNPMNIDKNGRRIYDLVVHTGTLNVDEVVKSIYQWLKNEGHVGEASEAAPQTENVIFQS